MAAVMIADKPQTRKYDLGTPGQVEKVAPGVFKVASWKNGQVSYLVDLGRRPSCNCPAFLHANRPRIGRLWEQEVVECKHVKQARSAEFERARLIAGTLTDDELERARQIHESRRNLIVATACLLEQGDRLQVTA